MREARYIDDGINDSKLTSDFPSFFFPTCPFELIGVYSEHTNTGPAPLPPSAVL